ncbi:hypothetical protein [Sulfobacillus thermosulfidooxidans]|uniref:pyroglutamyl-peptidase I family protein n=1 Tax=Sulfobacillus thermosulfidooxidans TaxID=28034 RepID=UPI000423AF59|nr:hypothetical protein [Sulfobacillus thermosulfidooxidans]
MILVTYFDPFGGDTVNVSQEVATRLPQRDYIVSAELKTSKRDVEQQIPELIAKVRPDAILGLGQAEGRGVPTLERVGINLIDSRIEDNRHEQYHDEMVVPDGPPAYFSTLPVRQIVETVHQHGLPIELSLSAGAFMCNQALYLMRHTARNIPAGFLHLPLLPSQAASRRHIASMGLTDQIAVVSIVLDTIWLWLQRGESH